MAYAGGYTGSVRRDETFVFIRDLMAASQPSLSHSIFTIQKDITNAMRCYITLGVSIMAHDSNACPNFFGCKFFLELFLVSFSLSLFISLGSSQWTG